MSCTIRRINKKRFVFLAHRFDSHQEGSFRNIYPDPKIPHLSKFAGKCKNGVD